MSKHVHTSFRLIPISYTYKIHFVLLYTSDALNLPQIHFTYFLHFIYPSQTFVKMMFCCPEEVEMLFEKCKNKNIYLLKNK